ncbi:phosphoribosyltransferase [Legionella cardiaca]|uniref:Phosphoribosyltransferase family protein n=1 Tax=Legionella cardiaca TaxID=1071983 RepID=A0ABY8AVT7_9GAMM|nr:phosphoribosyltransferase family protein [Legionella cardiaca]WED44593.1 phosphoribosyltransferase family protein [Legionella cardiaca]
MKEKILKKLQKIHSLKTEVTKRVWNNAHPVREIDEDKFDKKGEALTESVIKQRIKLLAERLMKEYPTSNPVLVSLMDGALPFASLLQQELNARGYQYSYTAMQASSYGDEMTSGELKIGSMPKIPLGGRTVFVVDDVCDTGKTYLKIRELLQNQGALKVALVVLVDKVQKRVGNYRPEYVGFEVPADAFIVGMGLDYYGELRNEFEIRAVDVNFLPSPAEKEQLDKEKSLNAELVKLIALEKEAKPGSSNLTIFGLNKDGLNKESLPSHTAQPLPEPEDSYTFQ